MGKRSYGTGSLFVRANGRGEEAWYAQWRVDGKLVKKRIGPKRRPSSSEGLTKSQAERELRRLTESSARLRSSRPRSAAIRSSSRRRASAWSPSSSPWRKPVIAAHRYSAMVESAFAPSAQLAWGAAQGRQASLRRGRGPEVTMPPPTGRPSATVAADPESRAAFLAALGA